MLIKNTKDYKLQTFKTYDLNFGPQHPSAHGVLRLILTCKGELVTHADPHIGLLHRGTEKLIEHKTYLQALPYFDRLDYVSMLAQEHVYVLAIENLNKTKISLRASQIRVLFLEITRLLNHLMSLTTHALDVGALTPFLWGFEERENLMELYEIVSGARMHAAFFRPGGISQDLPKNFLLIAFDIFEKFNKRIQEIEELLTSNRIWKARLIDIGVISKKEITSLGFTGVFTRASGCFWDLRIKQPYEIYQNLYESNIFQIPIAKNGDSYSRYLVRIFEMKESVKIIQNILENLLKNQNKNINKKKITKNNLIQMENLITHYKQYADGFNSIKGEVYASAETPKGELGVYLMSNGSNKPYRLKIRPTGFAHLLGLNYISKNLMISDIVTIIGTMDIVFGEVDR
jgi:NADH dehydrogenase I D subunit